MARMLTLLAILGVLSASSLVAADDNCTVSPVVTVQPAYTFNVDDYIFVDGDFDQFQTCDDVSSLVWTVNGVSDYGRYFYEPAAQFGPGTYAGRLDVYLSPYYYGNYTLSATYDFNVTVLNQTTPTDAPSGSGACVPSPTVVLDSNYVFGTNDYISIDGDFSYFRSCDLTASLTWLVTGADNVAVYNTSGWSFYSYPGTLAPGDYNGTLQVFLGDDTTPASETTFGLTIVNGSVPTDAPATDAPSGSGTQCYTSPTVLLQSDYYFDVSTDVSIYGDYYYFQSCDQLVNLQWAVGALNSTGYSFWEPADTFAIGSYPGSLNVYFGDNETLVASYSFTVTIGNDTQPTFAPFTDAPFTDAPPAPCEPDYSVFLSSNYWFEKSEDIVINPDLDFFNTCGADYELDWTLNNFKETGSSFFEAAGALTVGDYSGSLNVLVNGTLVNSQFFNVTVYDGNATAVAARAVAGRRLTLIKLRAAKKAMAVKKPRSVVARALARAAAGSACSAKKLAVGLKLKYTAASTSTVAIRPNVRKLVGCGTHPALVWRVGRAVSTGRQMTLRRGAFAPGAYMGTLEVHSGRTVVKHTFLVVVEGAKASTSYKYQPEAKMQARLLGSTRSSSSSSASGSSTSAGTTSKTTMIVAGAAGVSLVALVAVGIAFAMRRRSTAGSAHDVERDYLVQA